MPLPINLAQGFFNLSGGDPLSNLGNVVTGNVDLQSLFGTPTSQYTNALSLNNPTLLAEAWSQLSPYIPLPNFTIDPRVLAIAARIPLPSNFTSRVPSTYSIRYPMPAYPREPLPWAPAPRVPPNLEKAGLTKFIAQVRDRNLAFKSKFRITLPNAVGISNPTSIVGDVQMTAEDISLFCENAELPGLAYGTSQFHVYGPSFERPTMVGYGGDNITLMFLVDQAFQVRKYFENWMRLIADPAKYEFNYPDAYLSSGIIITQLKHADPELVNGDIGVYSARLIDAYPKALVGMQTHGADRDFHRLAVTFTYRQWVPVYDDKEPEFYYGSNDFVTVGDATTPQS